MFSNVNFTIDCSKVNEKCCYHAFNYFLTTMSVTQQKRKSNNYVTTKAAVLLSWRKWTNEFTVLTSRYPSSESVFIVRDGVCFLLWKVSLCW